MAQIVPVLLLTLVVEWRALVPLLATPNRRLAATLFFGFMAVIFTADELLVVIGIETDGLGSGRGTVAWIFSGVLFVGTILTALLTLATRANLTDSSD